MPRTILIVDDSEIDLSLLSNLLQNEYIVLNASCSEEVFSVLQGNAYMISAILLDLVMPSPDGFEILSTIRSHDEYRQIPVILTTSLTDNESQVRAMSLGANGYVFKPFNKELLLYTLHNAIDLHEKSAIINTYGRDTMTGLLNRTAFFESAEAMLLSKPAGYYILSCFDIENFKIINSQYGIDTGDKVLKHIATAISDAMVEIEGICFRDGADKFGMLYPAHFKRSPALSRMIEKVTFSEHTGRKVKIRIGNCITDDLSVPVSVMYDHATLAEESIKGRYDINTAEYTDSMRTRLLREQHIVNNMDKALANDEFELWLQPQYNHATGALIGAEALVRWRNNGVLISPVEFIPVFERNGFIYELDQYMWEQTCKYLRKWLDNGNAPLPVSVNISRRDLFHQHFIQVLTGIINKYNIPYDLIRLEVTESAFSESTGVIISKVNSLIDLGFIVEIDDFGSGYSSLNTLKDVPVQILKLDMRFFEKTENTERGGNIIESVIRMAKWLGMAVIAEGVEDKEQADYLKSIGCYYIQGYYYSKPMPVAEYEKLMTSTAKEPKLTRLQTLTNLDNNEFWNPKSMETLIFNSYIGGACIFEYYNGKTELLRKNEQYTRELGGLVKEDAQLENSSIKPFLDEKNKALLDNAVNNAIIQQKEQACEVVLTDGKQKEYMRITVRLIARAAEHYLFYCVIGNITEQREAERKQIESANRLKIIMSNINGGVSAILIDENGKSKFIFSNDKYYELYGYTREEAENLKLDVMETILPEDFPGVIGKIKKLKADRIPAVIDYRCTRKDGKIAYLRSTSSLMTMDGYDDVITSVVTDITEQRELEEQLRAIVDNINGGVTATVIQNDIPRFIVVNNMFFKMLGYSSREEFESTGMSKYTGLHPDDRERVINTFETSDGGKKQYTMEYRIIRRDTGEIRYIRNNISVIKLFGVEAPVQLSVANDITDLRIAQKKELRSLAELSAVLNNAGNGITAMVLHDRKPEFLFINDKYYEIVGYSKEEYAVLTANDMLAAAHPDDREALRKSVLEINKSNGSATVEYRVIRADKKTVRIRAVITITTLIGIDAPVQIGVFSDITAETEANERLRFLNDTAHDILATPDTEAAINATLEKLLVYFSGDRAYVIEFDYEKSVSNNTYEKCADGVISEIDMLKNVPFDVANYWLVLLKNNEFVIIDDVSALGDDKKELRELLTLQNITSLIVAPVLRDGVLMGFVGIDNPKQSVNSLYRLQAIGDYIAVLLTRRDLTAKIKSDTAIMTALMDDTPGGFVRMKLKENGIFVPVYANEGFSKLVGMSPANLHALYGDNALGGVHPDDKHIVQAAADKMLADGKAESARFRVLNGEGNYIWLTLYGRITKDASGDTFLNIYYSDATEQTKEEQLQKDLLDNLPCGAALYEYDGKSFSAIHINKSYWELVERPPTDCSEASIFEAIHEGDREIVRGEIEAAVRQGRNAEVNVRILCGSSTYKPFRIYAKVTKEKNGKYLFYASYTPLTEQNMSIQEMLPIALSTMMSASEDFSYVKDRDLRYIYCSNSVAKLVGFDSPEAVLGKSDYELFDKTHAENIVSQDKQVVEQGKSIIDITDKMQVKNGSLLILSTSKYPITDVLGNVIGLYGISRDVTVQRERESQLGLLTSSIAGGLATYSVKFTKDGANLKMLYFNDGYFGFSGYSREEYSAMTENNPLALVLDEDKPKVLDIINNITENIEDGHVNGCIIRCRKKDGGYRWISMKTVLSKMGEHKYNINVVQLDITEQQEEKEMLRRREEEYRLAAEHSKRTICRYDIAERSLTIASETAERLSLPEKISDVPYSRVRLGLISPDTSKAYIDFYERIIRGDRESTAVFLKKLYSGWRWLNAHATTTYDKDGKPAYAIISYADVTNQQEKEAVYRKWEQELKTRDISGYSLYRTTLNNNSISDTREGALLDFLPPENADMTFDERVVDCARRMVFEPDRSRYIELLRSDRLLSDYRRGNSSVSYDFRAIFPDGSLRWLRISAELVEYPNSTDVQAYLLYEDINDSKTEEIKTKTAAETDPLTGLLNRTTFENRMNEKLKSGKNNSLYALFLTDLDGFKLINDSFGHSVGDKVLIDAGTAIRSVLRESDLICRMGGDEFLICLCDMPDKASVLKKAKQLCSLTSKSFNLDIRVSTSLGIALYPDDGADFASLYVKADKALYYVKEHGKDNCAFYNKKMSQTVSESDTKTLGIVASQTGAKRKMLIADDNKLNRILFENIFKNDFNITSVSNGQDALVYLRRFGAEVSVVLLDLVMPEMDGFTVLERMSVSADMQAIPVVAVSRADDRETSLRAIRAGASDYVTKPVDADLLRIRVASAISKAENARLRSINHSLSLRKYEMDKIKAILEDEGTAVVEYDRISDVFKYDDEISKRLWGNYDSRPLWDILQSDGVADENTVDILKEMLKELFSDEAIERKSVKTEVRLKVNNGGFHIFKVKAIKFDVDFISELSGDKLLLAFTDTGLAQ